jgi:hypothetical protein
MTTVCLVLEYATTLDMADGQPLPPIREHGAIWSVVRRRCGHTVWRRLRLAPSAALTTSPPREAPPRGNHRDWHGLHEFCSARLELLRPHEHDFIVGLKSWRGALSERQHSWLTAIHARLHGAAN